MLSQARAAVTAISHVAKMVFAKRLPADRVLAAYIREHRELGARDRRIISETAYSLFRWWGWLRRLAPEWSAQHILSSDISQNTHQYPHVWQRLALAAAVAGQTAEQDVMAILARQCHISPDQLARPYSIGDVFERTHAILTVLGFPSTLHINELLPEWSLKLFPKHCDADRLILFCQKRPPLWLRIQSVEPDHVIRELKQAGISPQRAEAVPFAAMVPEGCSNLYLLKPYKEGRVEIQDISSQAVGLVCAPHAGERWWDACAGGGGKTLLLAQMMKGRGTVVASDIRQSKLRETRRRAAKAGFSNISTKPWNGASHPSWARSFDGVLVDAPCSCSGTWRRNPAARWTLRENDVSELAELQLRLLSSAARALKPGGILVYSTCSLFETENTATVRRFIELHPQFSPEPFTHPLTGKLLNDGQTYLWPWEGDGDGMFVARLRRNS